MNLLESLKRWTTVVADTGDIRSHRRAQAAGRDHQPVTALAGGPEAAVQLASTTRTTLAAALTRSQRPGPLAELLTPTAAGTLTSRAIHADARTMRLYDRRQKSVTRNTVEKISI